MKTHTTRGTEMLDRLVVRLALGTLPQTKILHNIVLSHHECWDGSGYPSGLSGTDIPLEARIVTVADVYDALTSARPYKEPWSPKKASDYLSEHAGTRFDPDVVTGFHAAFDEIEIIRLRFQDEPDTIHFREGYTSDL